jgi:hypothetical protein
MAALARRILNWPSQERPPQEIPHREWNPLLFLAAVLVTLYLIQNHLPVGIANALHFYLSF